MIRECHLFKSTFKTTSFTPPMVSNSVAEIRLPTSPYNQQTYFFSVALQAKAFCHLVNKLYGKSIITNLSLHCL